MSKNITYLKTLLVLLLLMNVFLGYKVIKAKYFRYDPDYTYNRKVLFESLNVDIDSNSIVFIGNSLTQQFELAELFRDVNIRNRGINGDNSSGVLSRLSDVTKFQPKKIFLENGINDIIGGVSTEQLIENFKTIVTRIKTESPVTRVYVQSILPVHLKGPAVVQAGISNEKISQVNEAVSKYCEENDVTYIDLHKHFQLNGQMNPRYCIPDGLHISGDGYRLWTKLLRPYMQD